MELLIKQFSLALCYCFSLQLKYPCHSTSSSLSDSRGLHVVFVGGESGTEAGVFRYCFDFHLPTIFSPTADTSLRRPI
jgi:hypothetical protein